MSYTHIFRLARAKERFRGYERVWGYAAKATQRNTSCDIF